MVAAIVFLSHLYYCRVKVVPRFNKATQVTCGSTSMAAVFIFYFADEPLIRRELQASSPSDGSF